MIDVERHETLRQRRVHRWTLALTLSFLGVGAFLLVTEHRAQAYGWLPHLLLGACIVLLVLGTRGNGDDAKRRDRP